MKGNWVEEDCALGWTETDVETEICGNNLSNESPKRFNETPAVKTTLNQRKAVKRTLQEALHNKEDLVDHRRVTLEPLFESEVERTKKNDLSWIKYVKIKPFPTNIPTAQKWESWLDYRRKLRIQLEPYTGASERILAGLLFTNIGEEVEQIISTRNLFPEVEDVDADFPHFTHLIEGLDGYFRGLSDETVNFSGFANMKQKTTESARDFQTRLIRQAEVCDLKEAKPMIRNQFIQGMRDREHAKRAFTDGTTLEDIVSAASRNESLMATTSLANPLAPWNDKQYPQEVASLTSDSRDRFSRSGQAKRGRWQGGNDRQHKDNQRNDIKPCGNCGIRAHRYNSCPAEGKKCNSCGKVGHFAKVCKQKSATVAVVENGEHEETEKKVSLID